ncbi:cobW-domain-containing protein [Gloeophyllum trabeum ATCC 11539]|uniref:CobW-domain-containing protein n=1 Tax=Gloeophyllum trabeum (strain ATCC 11539 / FP-39264 / Madison 617) TaxID=670483 RepID=S7Q499_GLOTA|nr:cobW-domain-containing protein [Gloeophyllum trabeum ATCC 11539]EPQ54298.1 cobW-domain-containing protein [Gloeophyllum trabeum ATCC 11539]
MPGKSPIPITVFTGFLGAGKTSIILSLLPQLPKDYKVVLLKNEFGDVEVDSQLAKQSHLTAVSEILNGCMCCVLVGQMKTALLEIRDNYWPDRIIIECSGSAFPATLAFQIRELERETRGDFKLDAIVTVIDAENFTGYEDSSPTSKMQASYTDVILINKWEHVSERQLDILIDELNTLNDLTPKIRCQGRNGVDPNLIFGLDTKLFSETDKELTRIDGTHNEEVETVTIYKGPASEKPHSHHDHGRGHDDQKTEDGNLEETAVEPVKEDILVAALNELSKESVWRVKGFVRVPGGTKILNWAFGRFELTDLQGGKSEGAVIRLTAMGERGEVKRAIREFAAALDAELL